MRPADAARDAYLDTTTADRDYRHILTVTPRTGSVVRWTDYFQDLVVGGNTYRAGGERTTYPKVEVGDREEVEGLEIGKLGLKIHCGTVALFNGTRLTTFAAQRGFDGALVLVERLYPNPAGGWFDPMHLFSGRVGRVEPGSFVVEMEIETGVALLSKLLPRHKYQAACVHMVYDAECTLSRASFTQTGFTVKASPAPTTSGFSFDTGTLSTDPGRVASYYRLGVVKFTSGALNGVERGVRAYAWATNVGAVTFDRPTAVAPASGDTFEIYPGCPRTLAACTNNDIAVGPQFNNKPHFRGFPFVPRNEAAL